MASEQHDPIPAVSGDNVIERYEALWEHICQRNLKTPIKCPHEVALERSTYGHRFDAGCIGLLCHDCKALVLAYEAKQREAASKGFSAEVMSEGGKIMTATELRERMSEVNPSDFARKMMGEVGCPRDTNGDGDCGRPGCPKCSPHRRPREGQAAMESRSSGRTSRMFDVIFEMCLREVAPKSICVVMPNRDMAREFIGAIVGKARQTDTSVYAKTPGIATILNTDVDAIAVTEPAVGRHPDFYIVDHWAFEHWHELMKPAKSREEEAAKPDRPLQPGDVVQLKSGGPKMTVHNIREEKGTAEVMYFDYDSKLYRNECLPIRALTKIQ